jgi:hypothetical protein
VARPPWGLRLPGTIQLALHTVVQGRAWLWLADPRDAVELAPGDLALVVGGPDHHIADEPGAVCVSPERFRERHADDELADHEHADYRAATVFLCGAYRFSGDVGRGLIQTLPPILLLSAAAHDPIHDVVGLLSRELSGPAPGQQTVLDRLLDVLSGARPPHVGIKPRPIPGSAPPCTRSTPKPVIPGPCPNLRR